MDLQYVIFNATGGLAIFLYGMKQLSEGLQSLAGTKLRRAIRAFTSNHFTGLLVGAGVTMVIQSSSITTVMLVGLLNAGIMTLKQSVGVIFGANIGTTITAQIIAFKISKYALPMIATGLIMSTVGRSSKIKFTGQVFTSLAFIFLGLKFMKNAFEPLKESSAVMEFCAGLSHHPILAVLCGLILTVIIQSSSASIGITITMAQTGLIEFPAALYLLLGDNIGTTITAWLASIGSCLSARRMALVHTLFNITGAVYFGILVASGIYPALVDRITPGDINPDTIARHIANAHSIFNIVNAIVLTPFAGLLTWIALKAFKGEEVHTTGEPKFIDDHLLDTPDVAVDQVVKEIHHMASLAEQSFSNACRSFINEDTKTAKEVKTLERAVDQLQQEITRYLVKLFGKHSDETLSSRLPSLLHSINDLEKISDHADSIAKLTLKRVETPYTFSADAQKDLSDIFDASLTMFDLAKINIEQPKKETCKAIFQQEDLIDSLKKNAIGNHIERLKDKSCHPIAGLAFVAFINHVEKAADHLVNVTDAVESEFVYDHGAGVKPAVKHKAKA